jgi:hypothetical protein
MSKVKTHQRTSKIGKVTLIHEYSKNGKKKEPAPQERQSKDGGQMSAREMSQVFSAMLDEKGRPKNLGQFTKVMNEYKETYGKEKVNTALSRTFATGGSTKSLSILDYLDDIEEPLEKGIQLVILDDSLEKGRVKTHTRKTKTGKMSRVKEHGRKGGKKKTPASLSKEIVGFLSTKGYKVDSRERDGGRIKTWLDWSGPKGSDKPGPGLKEQKTWDPDKADLHGRGWVKKYVPKDSKWGVEAFYSEVKKKYPEAKMRTNHRGEMEIYGDGFEIEEQGTGLFVGVYAGKKAKEAKMGLDTTKSLSELVDLKDDEPLEKSDQLVVMKGRVKAHTRKTITGKMSRVKEHGRKVAKVMKKSEAKQMAREIRGFVIGKPTYYLHEVLEHYTVGMSQKDKYLVEDTYYEMLKAGEFADIT